MLTGTDTPEAAAERLAEVVETVVITLDARGVLAIVGGRGRRAGLRPGPWSTRPATAT